MVHPPSLDEFKRARNPKLAAGLLAMRLTPHNTQPAGLIPVCGYSSNGLADFYRPSMRMVKQYGLGLSSLSSSWPRRPWARNRARHARMRRGAVWKGQAICRRGAPSATMGSAWERRRIR
jgi:hypothetical protein